MVTKEQIENALKSVTDPELGIDVITLGLVYSIVVDSECNVEIEMTFTTPLCPYGQAMIDDIRTRVMKLKPKTVNVKIVLDPPWKPSEEVMAALGM